MSKKLIGKARQRERKKNRTRNGNGVSVDAVSNDTDEQLLRQVWNSCPTMIHENDYVSMNCVICGTEMKSIHDTHNPQPITDKCYAKEALEEGRKDRCCTYCDKTVVIPARFNAIGLKWDPDILSKGVVTQVPIAKSEVRRISVEELSKMGSWEDTIRKDVA